MTTPIEDTRTTYRSMQHWYALARAEAEIRDWEIQYGGAHPSSFNARIASYLDTARALRLELETGEPHCSCHLLTDAERIAQGTRARRLPR